MPLSTFSRNIKLLISYDGTNFSGWQKQLRDRTIQGEIEKCLCRMTQEVVHLHGAGRTDSGVHAEGMVANFNTRSAISCHKLLSGLNSMLVEAIRILEAEEIEHDFHSRFAAKGKRYQYSLYTGKIQPPLERLYSVHIRDSLNLEFIRKCLQILEGSHDFSSFENSGSRDKTLTGGRGAVRTIYRAELIELPPFKLLFQFTGDGFLRNMVRNLMGTLIEVGRQRLTPEDFQYILHKKDRKSAATTAPAHGLVLKEVIY